MISPKTSPLSSRPPVAPVDQSHRDLSHALYTRELDPMDFTVVAQRRIEETGLCIDLFVLAESHLAVVRTGPCRVVSELLACREHDDARDRGLAQRPPRPGKRLVAAVGDGSIKTALWTTAHRLDETPTLQARGDHAVRVLFPAPRTEAAPGLTELWAAATMSAVEIRSLHWYPQEGVAVWTATQVLRSMEGKAL